MKGIDYHDNKTNFTITRMIAGYDVRSRPHKVD
jgi:hypothetical protein